jgi:hypothetical protein
MPQCTRFRMIVQKDVAINQNDLGTGSNFNYAFHSFQLSVYEQAHSND